MEAGHARQDQAQRGRPCQHELAPIFTTTNIAIDHNQLTMEMMKKVARHGLVCLLHEKPFEGVNGSRQAQQLVHPRHRREPAGSRARPHGEPAVPAVPAAVIKAVDEYQDLLRISVATAGNDHRLGANEAPPAIISIFLGDELDGYSRRHRSTIPTPAVKMKMELGVDVLPKFSKDTTDRNRTSPSRSPATSSSSVCPAPREPVRAATSC